MKTKRPAAKRVIWPPRMTAKRKRALALLQEWADKEVELECSTGAGMSFAGLIYEVGAENRRTSFVFRNNFGVHAYLPTDIYDRIEITEIEDLPTNVGFFRKGLSGDGFSVRPKYKPATQKKDIERVHELFRQWERLDTMLTFNTGDGMCSTVAHGKVKELSDRFMFTVAGTKTVHLVAPAQCSSVYFVIDGDELNVMLYNEKSGLHFTVTNRVEKPEDVINRFSALTTVIQ